MCPFVCAYTYTFAHQYVIKISLFLSLSICVSDYAHEYNLPSHYSILMKIWFFFFFFCCCCCYTCIYLQYKTFNLWILFILPQHEALVFVEAPNRTLYCLLCRSVFQDPVITQCGVSNWSCVYRYHFCLTLTKGNKWQITKIWDIDVFKSDLACSSSTPSFEPNHSFCWKLFKWKYNDIALMSMYMTGTFCSFYEKCQMSNFKSCFLQICLRIMKL